MPAASSVEICNTALTLIGAPTIVSLKANSREAKACDSIYNPSRRAVLAMHPWTFAQVRVTTAPDAETPDFNYTYQHSFPSDALVIKPVGKSRHSQQDYKIEGRKILTDEDTLYLRYTKDLTDTSLFSDLFADALAHHIAWKLAISLVQGNTGRRLKDSIWQDFQHTLAKARHGDSGQQAGVTMEDFSLDDSRCQGVSLERDIT